MFDRLDQGLGFHAPQGSQCQPGPDLVHSEQLLEQGAILGLHEAVEGDGVLPDLGVNVQGDFGSEFELGPRTLIHKDLVAHSLDIHDDAVVEEVLDHSPEASDHWRRSRAWWRGAWAR